MKRKHNGINFIARNNRDKYFFQCWLRGSITPLVVNLHRFDKGSFTSPSLKRSCEYKSLIWSHLLLIMLDSLNWKRPQRQESGCEMVQHGCASLPGTGFAVPSSSGFLHGGSARWVAWSWKQVLLHVPQAAPFPGIASSSTLCCSQTTIFYRGHLESLKFTFWFCSENECLNVRNAFGLKTIDSGSLQQRSWTIKINGPCASFCTDAHANKLYDWSMLLQMILHLVIVPEVHVHCLRALGHKERTKIEGLILPNF